VRRIELGWGASVIGELAGQVTLVVYAFDTGGAVLVATYVASRTVLSMAVAMREGEVGDLFHVIVTGTAAVSVRGEARPPLVPGDCFGEIALLRGIPRTATVVADQSLRTLALDRETFLVAVTGNRVSSAEADALVTRRLAADSPADRDAPGPA
jgi:CRP-like cAMP-binding protein